MSGKVYVCVIHLYMKPVAWLLCVYDFANRICNDECNVSCMKMSCVWKSSDCEKKQGMQLS